MTVAREGGVTGRVGMEKSADESRVGVAGVDAGAGGGGGGSDGSGDVCLLVISRCSTGVRAQRCHVFSEYASEAYNGESCSVTQVRK